MYAEGLKQSLPKWKTWIMGKDAELSYFAFQGIAESERQKFSARSHLL